MPPEVQGTSQRRRPSTADRPEQTTDRPIERTFVSGGGRSGRSHRRGCCNSVGAIRMSYPIERERQDARRRVLESFIDAHAAVVARRHAYKVDLGRMADGAHASDTRALPFDVSRRVVVIVPSANHHRISTPLHSYESGRSSCWCSSIITEAASRTRPCHRTWYR